MKRKLGFKLLSLFVVGLIISYGLLTYLVIQRESDVFLSYVLNFSSGTAPSDVVRKEIVDTRNKLLFYGLLLLLGSGTAILITMKRMIIAPLMQIQEAIGSYQEGDFSKRININSGDEFSRVAATFNEMADKLADFHERLETMVSQRTQEVIRLREELDKEKYFSSIGQMASWVAHEVKNPMFAIGSIAKILKKQTVGEAQEKFVDSIIKEANKLNLLVNDLLQFGRPLDLKIERVVLTAFISTVIDGLKSFATENNCQIGMSVDDGVEAEFDGDRMEHVFYNLIKNAIEAGADKIWISSLVKENTVTISIIDNGKGIKPDELKNMFIPFFTTKKEGTGLGLLICKKIIEKHSGEISISSSVGAGASVSISFKRSLGALATKDVDNKTYPC